MLNKDYFYLLPSRSSERVCALNLDRVTHFEANGPKIGQIEVQESDSGKTPVATESDLEQSGALDGSGVVLCEGKFTDAGNLDVDIEQIEDFLDVDDNIAWEDKCEFPEAPDCCRGKAGLLMNDINDLSSRTGIDAEKILERYAGRIIDQDDAWQFIYIGVRNRLDYQGLLNPVRWVSWFRETSRWVKYQEVIRYLRQSARWNIRSYPILRLENGTEEVIFSTRYRSSTASSGIRERVKKIILGEIGLPRFATAYAVVATRSDSVTNLDSLLGYIREHTLRGLAPEAILKVHRFNSFRLPRKQILEVGDDQRTNYIVILSRWSLVSERREYEAGILKKLNASGLRDYIKSPEYYGSGEWCGVRFHIQQAIEGITIDTMQGSISIIEKQAIALIGGFHKKTVKRTIVDNAVYQELIGWIVDLAKVKYGRIHEIIDIINGMEVQWKTLLLGKELSTAWMHGDFKIENIIVDPVNYQIEGIIDWEHSREQGLPSLDVWYLLVYDKEIHEESGIYKVMMDMCIHDKLGENERTAIESHDLEMGYSAEIANVMKTVFIVHHVVCRMSHDFRKKEVLQTVKPVLEESLLLLNEACANRTSRSA